ncbi:hypothetical protein ACNQFN_18835 [Thauera butanivorans]|uniref:hypothetical protein n=1 Tax=Thauera butanivorans TaxID=86174 RepID=UPI003AB88A64
MENTVEVLFTLKRQIDLQNDVDLRRGNRLAVDGPDRAYLHYLYRDPQGREREEVAALWVLDITTAGVLAAGLGVPDPQGCDIKPFRVLWIRDGIIATHSAPLGIDRAMWLAAALADHDVLDRDAQLFGGEAVDFGDA